MEGWVTHVAHCRNGILKSDCVNDINDVSVSKDYSVK
jgi:hypothetical protein